MAARDEIPGLGLGGDRPRLNTALDLAGQRLTPTEGFVLSRVDGRATYDDICKVSALDRDATLEILRRLKRQRIILGPGEVAVVPAARHPAPAPPVPAAPARDTRTPGEKAPQKPAQSPAAKTPPAGAPPRPDPPRSALERLDDGSPVGPGDLVEWPDASPDLKARIVRLHRRLPKLSVRDLLGVSDDATPAEIRQAFAAASKELHPDRYFGKNLGSFKPKLATIFARIAEAAQELQRAQKGRRP